MKKILKNLKLFGATLISVSLVSPIMLTINSSKINIDNKLQKQQRTTSVNFTNNSRLVNYNYTDDVLSDLNGIAVYGNGLIQSDRNYANTNDMSRYAFAIRKNSNGLIRFYSNEGVQIANSVVNTPQHSMGFSFINNDYRSYMAQTYDLNSSETTRSSNGEFVMKAAREYAVDNKSFGGVFTLRIPYWHSFPYSWYQVGLINTENSSCSLMDCDEANYYEEISDINSRPFNYIQNGYSYTGNANGWVRAMVYFAVFDDKFWFTNQESSISISKKKSFSDIKLSEFKTLNSEESLSNYFQINATNTPAICIGTSDEGNSTLEISYDDNLQRVEVTARSYKKFVPNYSVDSESNLTDEYWIKDQQMTDTMYIPYSEFAPENTLLNTEISQNGYTISSDDTSMYGKAPYEISDEDIKNLVSSKYHTLFDNGVTTPVMSSDITVNSKTADNSTSITINVTVPAYVDKVTSTASCNIKIKGLTNKDTIIKRDVESNGILSTSPISSYYASQLVGISSGEKYIAIKQWIFDNKSNIFEYLPESLNLDDISLTISAGSSISSISVTITLNNVYNKGRITFKTFDPFEIKGFKVTGTNVKDSIQNSGVSASISETNSLSSYAPYELTNDLVSKFIATNYSNIFDNIPYDSINSNQVVISSINSRSSTEAQVIFSVPAYVDANISTNEFTIVIKNLENKDTVLETSGTVTGTLADKIASNVTEPELKEYVFINLVKNKAPNSSIDNISIDSIIYDNGQGVIRFNVILNKLIYNGEEIDSRPISKIVTLDGFKREILTTVNNFSDGKDIFKGSTDANSVSNSQIESWLSLNKNSILNNLPSDAVLTIVSIERNEEIGEIKINFTTSKYYNDESNLINENKIFTTIISGFDKVQTNNTMYWIMIMIYIIVASLIAALLIMFICKIFSKKSQELDQLRSRVVHNNQIEHKSEIVEFGKMPPPPKSNKKLTKSRKVSSSSPLPKKYK